MADRRKRRSTDGQGSNSLIQDQFAQENPQELWNASLQSAGINAFGPLGYNEWLQRDAFGQMEAAYGTALLNDPKLKRSDFYKSTFANPAAMSAFSPEAYKTYNIQQNPRDYYNQNLIDSKGQGAMTGASFYDKWLRSAGWDMVADMYGAEHSRNPQLTFQRYMTPNAFAQ